MINYTPDANFSEFLEEFGHPFTSRSVNDAILQKYRGILPDQLLIYWQQYGFCGFADGLFWITNPDDYEELLKDWLPESELTRSKHYVIARTGWGEMLVWEPTYGHKYTINPHFGFIKQEEDASKDIAKGKSDEEISIFFSIQEQKYFDQADNNQKPLFKRAVKKFGALAEDEMFYFNPAVAITDRTPFENVAKGNMFVQLDLLKELVEPEIINFFG